VPYLVVIKFGNIKTGHILREFSDLGPSSGTAIKFGILYLDVILYE
jgi:putative IMPACT (imprinted ancient) family translation regulator